ncbi:MAG: DUF2284 domain-containing protein [Firmicutes bacterium]|nr:DUF2284 domain-containing protein [Bacillota bacterium]
MLSDCKKEAEIISYALSLGATRAKTVDTGAVVVRDEVVTKWCAGCPEYGHNLMCPPAIPSPAEYRILLAGYRRGILTQLTAELAAGTGESGYGDAFRHGTRLHLLICELEDYARRAGYSKARGFIGGCCRLCGTCPGPGEECRNPDKARSSMEANGISVVETCAAVGWPIKFPVKDSVTWTGLVLLG